GEGIAGRVVATGQPQAITDARLEPSAGVDAAPILEATGLRSALAVPLRSGERVIGALLVANQTPRAFGAAELTLLASLANQVAVALANAESYARAQLAAERLERLIESSGDAIITTDLDGRILRWNRGAEAIYGWSRDEAIGAVLPMVPADLLGDARNLIRDLLAHRETVANYETERIRKDGRRIAVVVTTSVIRNAVGEAVGILGISKDMSAHRQLEEQERRLALLEDRDRIGMELHDGAIQSLYAVGLGLEAVAQVLETNPPLARTRLVQARDSINDVIQEIRNYIVGLRPETFQRHSLLVGLAGLAEELKISAQIDLEVDLCAEAVRAFDPEQTRDLFQFAREAMANVVRHAAATRVGLSLRPTDAGWVLRVWDNGVGFDAAVEPSSGFGLRNMRERARRVGGALELTSQPGRGTEVRLTVPDVGERSP
ncbi:MAG: PAS domain S-box protein, partial [Chloroflexi bacterium]|nr:PAS domain S-box protein [Chloroflexota bacterium]